MLLLLGDACIADLRLVGIDSALRRVIKPHKRNDDVDDLNLIANAFLEPQRYLLAELVKIWRANLSVAGRRERIVGTEYLVQRGIQFPGYETLANVVEIPVVSEQLICPVWSDAPTDGVVHLGN